MADRFQGLTVQLAHFGKSPEDAVTHYVQHLGLEALRQAKPFVRDLVDQWEKYKKAGQTVTKRYLNEVHWRAMSCQIVFQWKKLEKQFGLTSDSIRSRIGTIEHDFAIKPA
jgi:hypothetical protein